MRARRTVALVLHAHLPYVLPAGEDVRPAMAERWLYEALLGSYLPLLNVLDGLANDGVHAPITISVSPTLASMLASPRTKTRFERYLNALAELNTDHQALLHDDAKLQAAAVASADALRRARVSLDRIDGDVLGALQRHHRAGRIELMTTAVSHAYLPALAPAVGAAAAQLRLGRIAFARWAAPTGMWIPECGFNPSVDRALADVGARYAVVAAHAAIGPLRSQAGVGYLPRHRDASLRVWARADGYPGHCCYREFHRDAGVMLGAGSFGERAPIGLKYWRISSRSSEHKQPYEPLAAGRQALAHAADYSRWLELQPDPLVVPAFDAELFGHWWYEGPVFLDELLRRLADSDAVQLSTLGTSMDEALPTLGTPSASSWGRGGFSQPWLGPRTAPLVRHLHHAHRLVTRVAAARRDASGLRGRWLDQAIRELLLLQASDWAFMIDGDRCADYGRERFRRHLEGCRRFAELADGCETERSRDRVLLERGEAGFLAALVGATLRDGLLGPGASLDNPTHNKLPYTTPLYTCTPVVPKESQ